MRKTDSRIDCLRQLVPLDSISDAGLERFLDRMERTKVPAGEVIFRKGDRDDHAWWLLQGEVRMEDDGRQVCKVVGGSEAARCALAPRSPRPFTAVAETTAELLRVGNEILDIVLTWEQSAGYVVEEVAPGHAGGGGDEADWMNRMLGSWIFHRIPAPNIQDVFARMEPVDATAGETLIREGDPGDYFYVLTRGRAEVLHGGGSEERLAVLGPGDFFGEEALLSDSRRNATVRMLDAGGLMRLAREDFAELLREPALTTVAAEEAQDLVCEGRAIWVDVRMDCEFANWHIKGAVNLPLQRLRPLVERLPAGKILIVCCDTGRRSSAAAWLLCNWGFDARILRGGLQSAPASLVGASPVSCDPAGAGQAEKGADGGMTCG